MKILVGSYRFSPEVGGLETASAFLATEFVALGHDVKLLDCDDRDRPPGVGIRGNPTPFAQSAFGPGPLVRDLFPE